MKPNRTPITSPNRELRGFGAASLSAGQTVRFTAEFGFVSVKSELNNSEFKTKPAESQREKPTLGQIKGPYPANRRASLTGGQQDEDNLARPELSLHEAPPPKFATRLTRPWISHLRFQKVNFHNWKLTATLFTG